DYCFRAGGGVPSFFVEAKKPAVDIREAVDPAFQLRRYAWSAKLPVSILTDFEEWAVYDCRVRPVKTDRAATARVMYHTYTEYVDRWDELAGLFSPEAIRRGALDKFVASKKVKKGTAEVDDAFLGEIQAWRDALARNIALRNPQLSQRDLNFAVQRTIDRIVFLRICEDRGIERYGTLQALLNGPNVYRRLAELFQRADERYNSGLFHFTPEKGRPEPPDELTLGLAIDDRVLGGIIRDLYYPDSPYEFSVLPVEILGHVYEQFLGKVIRLTKGHRAVVEDKPEVKKAGGVYYTPTYIVDYIVEHTVGKLLGAESQEPRAESQESRAASAKPPLPPGEGRGEGGVPAGSMTPKQAARLRILDPACGSGSFLIGAYEYLLKWHRDWYETHDAEKHARGRNPKLYRGRAGDWRLTTAERKRILLNNIYGVDIDPQAVEVTKLSLLLKVLEGESQETLTNQLRLFHERALPDLSANIKCGNSLIGPDFYKGRQMSLLDEEEVYRINAFDWEAEFPHIFKGNNAGFDAVIGNPPYGADFPQTVSTYLKENFQTSVWRGESYLLFVEKAIGCVRLGGQFGYIIPDTYLNLGFTQSLRRFLLRNTKLREVVALPSKVFASATVDTTLLFVEKAAPAVTFHEAEVSVKAFGKKAPVTGIVQPSRDFHVPVSVWAEQNAFNVQSNRAEIGVLAQVERHSRPVSDFAEIFYGIKAYQVGKGKPPQTKKIRDAKPFTSSSKESESFLPFFDGKHIARYQLLWKENNWVNYGPWLAEPRKPEKYQGEKILIRKIVGDTLIATYIPETSYCNTLLFVLKTKPKRPLGYHGLLGMLNSQLIGWYFRKKFQITADDTFPQIMIRDILRFPVPVPDKGRHDRIVQLVERMLSLHQQLQSAKTAHHQTVLQRQIEATDREIDRLVYELYGLSDEEVRIVEEGTAR
ncbi:MAG: hypothetical protein A2V98_19805, partial [Planctomycetes bacterium RBG_16_64_12]